MAASSLIIVREMIPIQTKILLQISPEIFLLFNKKIGSKAPHTSHPINPAAHRGIRESARDRRQTTIPPALTAAGRDNFWASRKMIRTGTTRRRAVKQRCQITFAIGNQATPVAELPEMLLTGAGHMSVTINDHRQDLADK